MLFSSFVFIFAFLPFVWVIFHWLKSQRFARLYNGIYARFCAKFANKSTRTNTANATSAINAARVANATNTTHTKTPYTIAKIFLILASLFFYAFWKLAYLPILLGSIVVNYALARAILKNSAMSLATQSNSTNNGGGGKIIL